MDKDKIIGILSQVKEINYAYDLSTADIDKLSEQIDNANVCIPLIGKFSSGKSAIINALLGYSKKIQKEDITPETAVPAEIIYNDFEECAVVNYNDGSTEKIDIDEYRKRAFDANNVRCVNVNLTSSFLSEIPSVMLVDMPGFESGYKVHNKAIDNYLPKSMAYIIVFPADDMILRSSIKRILEELSINDMPLCIVISKCDKKNTEFDKTLQNLKDRLNQFIRNNDINYCSVTASEGDVDEVKRFLCDIQKRSQEIIANNFKQKVLLVVENTEQYLNTMLKNSALSESELAEKEDAYQKQLNAFGSKFLNEKSNFDSQIADCIEEIKADVRAAVENEESTLVAMIMNNQSINDHINSIVRNTVTVSIKKRLAPKIERYIKRVEDCINGNSIGDAGIYVNFSAENVSKGVAAPVVAAVAGLILGLPVLGAIIAVAAAIISKFSNDKKREEQKNKIRMQLRSEVYPKLMNEVGKGLEMEISKQILSINTSIETEIKNQRDTLEKAMADLKKQINDENKKKENLEKNIQSDLERIVGIKNELR